MKIKILIIRLIILAVIIGVAFLFYGIYLIYYPGEPGETKNFIIKEGQGVNEISQNLYKEDLIENKFVFETYIWFKKAENKLQAGEHALRPGMSIRNLVNNLTSGRTLTKERNITIIEGWNLKDIGRYLENEEIAKAEELYELAGFPAVDYNAAADLPALRDFSGEYEFLADKPKNISLEGYLFPDTYRIYVDSRIEDIVKKMLDNFGRKLNSELRDEIKRQRKTIFEVITLASIVEKEVPRDEDRKIVADIFLRRLKSGMPLQADSTINYITGKKRVRATSTDVQINSLYNTYKYPGLPLGPISNPGLSPILAVIYPTPNDYWYFLTTPEGEVIYSKTNNEHNKNKSKYLE